MQPPGGGIGRIGPLHRCGILGIQEQQVRGGDAGKMHLVGVHQELRAFGVHRETEMVRDPFVHVEPLGPAKGGGKVHPVLPVFDILSVHIGAQVGNGHGIHSGCRIVVLCAQPHASGHPWQGGNRDRLVSWQIILRFFQKVIL